MALSAEVQHGIARIHGIPPTGASVDEYLWTIAGISMLAVNAGTGLNPTSIGWTDSFKTDEIASADGSVIETLIASQQKRELTVELIPSSNSTTPTRSEAEAFVTHFLLNCKPFSVFVISGFKSTLSWVNSTSATSGSWNYMGGGEITLKRDTYCIMNVKLAQFLTRADGSIFAALPLAG